MLVETKLLLGISDNSKDTILNYLIDACSEEAIAYCNLTELPDNMERIVIKMVIQRYNRLGTEGVASQSFSGVSESFIDGYTLDIKTDLNRFRKIRLA